MRGFYNDTKKFLINVRCKKYTIKKYIYFTILLFLFLFNSCGGTTGNIEKYRFQDISTDSLKGIVKRVYVHYPELREFDSNRYQEGKSKLGDGDFYCTINDKEDNQKYLFNYIYVQYDPPNDGFVEIAITYAGKYGRKLKFDRELDSWEKRKYKRLFEEMFISEVRNEISSQKNRSERVKR